MKNTKKDFNKTVTAMWSTKTGNYLSMKIDDRTLQQLREFVENAEVGGKLILKNLNDDTRAKFKSGIEKAPNAFLEYISADSVAKFEAENPRNRNNDSSGL